MLLSKNHLLLAVLLVFLPVNYGIVTPERIAQGERDRNEQVRAYSSVPSQVPFSALRRVSSVAFEQVVTNGFPNVSPKLLERVVGFVPVNVASADSYVRSPSGSGTFQQMQFDVEITDLSSCTASWGLYGTQFDPSFLQIEFVGGFPTTTNSISQDVEFTSEMNIQQVTAGCDGDPGSLASLEFDNFAVLWQTETFVGGPPTATTSTSSLELIMGSIDEKFTYLFFLSAFLAVYWSTFLTFKHVNDSFNALHHG